jgi:hypothetical protein
MKESYKESEKYGSIRELMAARIFIEKGYNVALPIVKARYDMIVEKDGLYKKIQVKPLKITDQSKLKVNAFSTQNKITKIYSKDEIDYVLGIHIDTGKYILIPIEKITSNTGVVLFTEDGNPKSKYIDYLNWFKRNTDLPLS